MKKIAKKIFLGVPFVRPLSCASAMAAEAAPVAVSRIGLPHTLLFSFIPFAGWAGGYTAAAFAAAAAALAESLILSTKHKPKSNEWNMCAGFCGLHLFVFIALLAGLV